MQLFSPKNTILKLFYQIIHLQCTFLLQYKSNFDLNKIHKFLLCVDGLITLEYLLHLLVFLNHQSLKHFF